MGLHRVWKKSVFFSYLAYMGIDLYGSPLGTSIIMWTIHENQRFQTNQIFVEKSLFIGFRPWDRNLSQNDVFDVFALELRFYAFNMSEILW